MHILTEEEAQSTIMLKQGRNSALRKMLLQLKAGQTLFLPRAEWPSKHPPYGVARRIGTKTGWRFEYGKKPDHTGWLFKRLA